jgi:hypothetical protein
MKVLNENVYDVKGVERNRWGSILGGKKECIVNELNERLNNSCNPVPRKLKKGQHRYNYIQDGDQYSNYSRMNASSCEKLPKNKLEVNLKNNLDSRNKV